MLSCSAPIRLAHVPGATRLTELATGELLVGTESGQLWLVSAFGDTTRLTADLETGVEELVSDPLGGFWARASDGSIHGGNVWASTTRRVGAGAILLRRCEDTVWLTTGEAGPGVSALALGAGSCGTLVTGTADGRIDGRAVSEASIVRAQAIEGGVLWVDADRHAGCLGCSLPVPPRGVVDAASLHLAPFVAGEVVWIDTEGTLWTAPA